MRLPRPFSTDDTETFDGYDEFVVDHVPAPGEFLDGHDLLADGRHLAFHRLSRELFEERAVYDMTFGYNLARLNNDTRHRDAGYRYAVERADAVDEGDVATADSEAAVDPARVLRAEFTPTTAFCPQSNTLTKGSFRAWNGLADCHEYDLVRVRVAPMHQRAAEINAELRDMEREFVETGDLPDGDEAPETDIDEGTDTPGTGASDGSRAPF